MEGEVALVTGASRGIGRAVALKLARLGADVGLVQRSDAAATAAEVEQIGRRAHVVRADLTDPAAGEHAVEEVAEALGRLDVAVCSAGTIYRAPALDLPLERWQETISVNL